MQDHNSANLLNQIKANISPSDGYVAEGDASPALPHPLVRLIAYYLPQFHPIAENDAWWGKGFTDWTNVTKALPRFEGHYQPRLPGEFGFYDLRLPDILRRQAKLARRYGIEGFCFHYYWFGGKRLLETPLNMLLSQPDIDLPFCVNWANENWSRRWDGKDQEVLIAQQHSPEDDIAFAKSLEPLFRDPRYIKIDGRPLMMVYRPDILPDATSTVKRWRAHFVEAGLGNPYIVMAQTTDDDPRHYGMDAAAGFPPHRCGSEGDRINRSLKVLDPQYLGRVKDYSVMAAASLSNRPQEFKLFPGVCPNWDNEARRPNRGRCFHGSSPEKYGGWLAGACSNALHMERDERIVFINAWNEWAEGAYLEPDRHFGYAYLAKTASVLNHLALPAPGAGQQLPDQLHEFKARKKQRSFPRRVVSKLGNKTADVAEAFAQVIRP
jgi:lipopolysaccharide biosynthesis protein